jgi:dihydroflavonol-4-reductase
MSHPPSHNASLKPGDAICLTGGGGYLGRHVAAALLEQGFEVLITLRSLDKAETIRRDLSTHLGRAGLPIDFVQADLTGDRGWSVAIGSCKALVHTASPFPDRPPKNPQDLIRLAVEGTERVLRTAAALGKSRVVVTSSIVAVTNTTLPEGRVFHDERDWSQPDDPATDAYALSKLKSERKAWAVAEDLGLSLTVLNPGLIFGPPIGDSGATSVGIVKRFLRGRDPALPDAGFPSVDVRDAAMAHAQALLRPESIGQRIILAEATRSMADIAAIIARLYPSRAIRTGIATHQMVRMAAKFDPTLQSVLPHLGKSPEVLTDRAASLLGRPLHPVDAAIAETARMLMRSELEATAV